MELIFSLIFYHPKQIYILNISVNNIKKTDYFRAINYLPNRFDELGVDYLNLHEHFMNIKDCVDFNLFSRTGLHCSSISASYVSDTLIRYMEDLIGKTII